MALRDPIAVYNAANNLEAALVRQMLLAAEIEAHVVEDVSQVGTWMFGLLPEIHKPQVWVERTDIDRVRPVLEEYERREMAKRQTADGGTPVDVACEECERLSTFPASRRGSIEICPHCGAYVDVGDDSNFEEGSEIDRAEQEES